MGDMTVEQWVSVIRTDCQEMTECVMNLTVSEDGYNLEVETRPGYVQAIVHDLKGVREAKRCYQVVARALGKRGIQVRTDWS